MNIPENLKYTKDHEWIKIESKYARMGVTDFAQSELGDIVFVEVDSIDETLDQEEVFGTIEAVKTVSDLYMPVSGKVIEVNDALEDDPELINTNPYDQGWIIKIEISNKEELDGLITYKEYKNLIL